LVHGEAEAGAGELRAQPGDRDFIDVDFQSINYWFQILE
jgi:hypothetical protein